jgi:hypothetical protein
MSSNPNVVKKRKSNPRNKFDHRVKDLYNENYKTLKIEIEDNTKNCNKSYVHGLQHSILLKCPHYPKQSAYLMQPISKY